MDTLPADFDPDPQRGHRKLARLDDLAAIGMSFANLCLAQANRLARDESAMDVAEKLPKLTQAYNGVARSVRQTIALDSKLETAAKTPLRSTAEQDEARILRHRHARRRIIRVVEDRISRATPDSRENLLRDFYERLDDPDLVEQLDVLEPRDLISNILDDLGLGDAGRWANKPRTNADIADLNARAAAHPPRRASG